MHFLDEICPSSFIQGIPNVKKWRRFLEFTFQLFRLFCIWANIIAMCILFNRVKQYTQMIVAEKAGRLLLMQHSVWLALNLKKI